MLRKVVIFAAFKLVAFVGRTVVFAFVGKLVGVEVGLTVGLTVAVTTHKKLIKDHLIIE